MKRLYCAFFGHRYLPFPENDFAPTRCHRCEHALDGRVDRAAAMQRHPAGKKRA